MARTDNFNNWATDVANSIREMTGKTDLIPAANFDTEIKSIETSEDLSEELETYDNELSEQTISLKDLSSLLDNKTLPSGSTTLPDEYTRLLYIESTGTQYITTDVCPSNHLGFEIDYLIKNGLDMSTFGTLFGYRGNVANNGYHLTTFTGDATTKRGHFLFGTHSGGDNYAEYIRYDAGITPNQRESISFANRVFTKATGETLTLTSNTSLSTAKTSYITLFCLTQGTSMLAEHSKMQLYGLKFTYAGTAFRNYIPAMRKSDNTIGLYETFTGVFHTNAGTGAFLYGEIEG